MDGQGIQRVRLGGALELGDRVIEHEPSWVLIVLLALACALMAYTVIDDLRQRRGR